SCFLTIPRPPTSTLVPYTTLFRSGAGGLPWGRPAAGAAAPPGHRRAAWWSHRRPRRTRRIPPARTCPPTRPPAVHPPPGRRREVRLRSSRTAAAMPGPGRPSFAAAVRDPDEVVDHAVGQALEPERHRWAKQPHLGLEVQRQGDLAGRLVQRVELPPPRQAAEWPVHQLEVDMVRRGHGVFGGEPRPQRTKPEVQPRN